jgi:hypothetical protein
MIILAGLFAGLGYLTKSSVGAFFILAGLGGLAWRLHWKGWRVLRDPAYLAAIVVFGLLVAAWAARNWILFGDWQTSAHIAQAYQYALRHPGQWVLTASASFAFYAGFAYLLLQGLLPLVGELRRVPKLGDEHDSGLWLALGLPLVLTAFIDGALWLTEHGFALNNARYVGFVAIPALWLLVRHARIDRRETRIAIVAAFALLLLFAAFFAKPYVGQDPAFHEAAGHIGPGDSIGFIDIDNHGAYRMAFDLDPWSHTVVYTCLHDLRCPAGTPPPSTLGTDWIVSAGDVQAVPGYEQVFLDHGAGGAHATTDLRLWSRA